MRITVPWRLAALFTVGATAVTLAVGITPASAFTCPSESYCLFQGPSQTGHAFAWGTSLNRDTWLQVTALPGGFTTPWGSLHNNSNSCVELGKAGNSNIPVLPHVKAPPTGISDAAKSYDFIYIEYGNTGCTKSGIGEAP
jgi:Peptidase inhibitor family I36